MKLMTSTIAAILAFTLAGTNALPSPQVGEGAVSEAPTPSAHPPPPPPPESFPGYHPGEDFYVEKRDVQGKGKPLPAPGADHPAQGSVSGQKWRGSYGGVLDRHHFHGPMPDFDDSVDEYDYDDDDDDYYEPPPPPRRLARRSPIKMKTYHWWQEQTNNPGPIGNMATGNPLIRNFNFKEQNGYPQGWASKRSLEPEHRMSPGWKGARPLAGKGPNPWNGPVPGKHGGPMPDEAYYYADADEE